MEQQPAWVDEAWQRSGVDVSAKVSHPFFRRKLKNKLLSSSALFGSSPTTSKGSSAATRRGLRFEAKVCAFLTAQYGNRFLSQLPFFFEEEMGGDLKRGQRGKAIPDGLLFSPDWKAVCIIEIKLRHSGDAWWQLNKFYRPIVEKAFQGVFEVFVLEIVQYYDPRVKLPQRQSVLNNLEEVWGLRSVFHPVVLKDKTGR